MQKISLAIHGGAGTILKEDLTPELETAYKNGLETALNNGYKILEDGGTSIEAVKAAIIALEDNILFNAGRGAVFTKDGVQEMDAAIMEGNQLKAGAVAGVKNIRNPIELALQVMQKSDHVFLSGKGANDFALKQGIATEPDEYFFSQFRYEQWKQLSSSDDYSLDHNNKKAEEFKDKKFGTVGAVACDINGNIAAATSTGGMTNKQFGRIGDTPVIGAGTYANNKTCAISSTGHGEPFLRSVAAYDVRCLLEYKSLNLTAAMQEVVMNKLPKLDGEGGMIGVDTNGNMSLQFNSAGMYRAAKSSDGTNYIRIYKEGSAE